jgi:hypothetical protein
MFKNRPVLDSPQHLKPSPDKLLWGDSLENELHQVIGTNEMPQLLYRFSLTKQKQSSKRSTDKLPGKMKINIFRNSSMYYWSCPPFNKK